MLTKKAERLFLFTLFTAFSCVFWVLSSSALAAAATPSDTSFEGDGGRYREAQAALSRSLEVFTSDRVEALDTLREAETLLLGATADLTPALRRALATTVRRAEEAIVNQSETDFAVQRAVLGGGLGRALYEKALGAVQAGDDARARELLGVLATELELRPNSFGEGALGALQPTFEHRLAAHALEQLGALPSGEQSRSYRALAGLYGDLLTVQDSPRLPPETTTALLRAVERVVAGEAPDEPLGALRTHLSTFAENAQTAARTALPEPPVPERNVADDASTPNALGSGASGFSEPSLGQPSLSELSLNEPSLNEPSSGEPPAESAAAPQPLPDEYATGERKAEFSTGDVTGGAARDALTENINQGGAGTANGGEPLPALFTVTRPPPLLLALLGASALLAGLRAVGLAAAGRAPGQHAALALLLLPWALEGLAALAPLSGSARLAPLAVLSFFQQPAPHLLAVVLVTASVLLLALSWRQTAGKAKGEPAPDAPPSTLPQTSNPDTRSSSVVVYPRSLAPAGANASLDWDEDF